MPTPSAIRCLISMFFRGIFELRVPKDSNSDLLSSSWDFAFRSSIVILTVLSFCFSFSSANLSLVSNTAFVLLINFSLFSCPF